MMRRRWLAGRRFQGGKAWLGRAGTSGAPWHCMITAVISARLLPFAFLAFAVLLLPGCQTIGPGIMADGISGGSGSVAERAYENRLRQQIELASLATQPARAIDAQLHTTVTVADESPGHPEPPIDSIPQGHHDWKGKWRSAYAHLYLGDPAGQPPQGEFRFSGLNAWETRIYFRSLSERRLAVSARCDGPGVLIQGVVQRKLAAGEEFRFGLVAKERDNTVLIPGDNLHACGLTVRSEGVPGSRQISVRREEAQAGLLAGIDSGFRVCAAGGPSPGDRLADAFRSDRWLSQTCVMPVRDIRLLSDSRDAYNAKVFALTGKRLSDAEFDRGDPYMPIDFSAAPRLDAILVSYLDIKADFSGTLFVRMLRHHARHGATVRIMVANQILFGKDRRMIESLAAAFPNVQLQEYAWKPPAGSGLEDQIAGLHRVNHVKMLATLSREPQANRVIIGGRNIHDGFLFDRALDLSAHPELNQYSEQGLGDLNYFATYHDFEIELKGEASVREIAQQFSTLWLRDHRTNSVRPHAIGPASGTRIGSAGATGMRHFISWPREDGQALEAWYVEIIDGARSSIAIVTPYLNPTPAIEEALVRARERGVDITIATSFELDGDFAGNIVTDLNKLFAERNAGRFRIHVYKVPGFILHSKMVLIDGRFSIVTSANLNRRSFLFDGENGVAVLDPAFHRRMKAVLNGYLANSEPVPGDLEIPPAHRGLFANPILRNAM